MAMLVAKNENQEDAFHKDKTIFLNFFNWSTRLNSQHNYMLYVFV